MPSYVRLLVKTERNDPAIDEGRKSFIESSGSPNLMCIRIIWNPS